MSVWMTVVATAVAIDIVLFVLGGRMFSAGLYLSKLNNMLAGTLMFGVILYHYVRIQRELMCSRIHLIRANRRLNRMALTDPLTGLPNRACLYPFLDHALGRARRDQALLAVCVIDLDDFKPVNDRYGHQVGDELLCALAKRLSGVLRAGEFLVRQGGDEFVLVLEGLPDQQALKPVMERLVGTLTMPFSLGTASRSVSTPVSASRCFRRPKAPRPCCTRPMPPCIDPGTTSRHGIATGNCIPSSPWSTDGTEQCHQDESLFSIGTNLSDTLT